MDNTDYLISRTYTNYGGRKMSADEMFKELGYEKELCYYNSDVDTVSYIRNKKYSSNVTFYYRSKTVRVHYGKKENDGHITMDILQAINKKVLELRVVK